MTRIEKMIMGWNEDGRAFSNLQNNDNEFFIAINTPYENLGVTSQTGLDLVYYNTDTYDSDTNALRKRKN